MKATKHKLTFEEKVKGMTAGEIIMAMVDGLKKKHVQVRMDTFGEYADGICYGCAATNAICEISDVVFTPTVIGDEDERRKFVNSKERAFYCEFEYAIDCLRKGWVDSYNRVANGGEFAKIKIFEGVKLPHLYSDFTDADLEKYIELANLQS